MLADEVKKSDVGGRNMSISKGGEGTDVIVLFYKRITVIGF